MDAGDRPVIWARLVSSDDGAAFEGVDKRLEVGSQHLAWLTRLYAAANGSMRIRDMVPDLGSLSSLLEFFGTLEDMGLCTDAHRTAMIGHRSANWPDQQLMMPSEEEIRRIEEMPPDPADLPVIALPGAGVARHGNRRTVCEFRDEPVSLVQLADILAAAYGRRDGGDMPVRRPVPSAGALYPLRLHVFVLNCGELPPGHYLLSNRADSLLFAGGGAPRTLACTLGTSAWRQAAMVLVISFDIAKSSRKYGSRAYRFALLEAGHCAQNAMCAAADGGLGSWEYGGYHDTRLMRELRLDPAVAGIATVVLFGWPV